MGDRKLADSFIKSNEEYTKLKVGDETPRENPQRQSPEMRGHRIPEFESWTTSELREHTENLNMDNVNNMDRDTLIEAINEHLKA